MHVWIQGAFQDAVYIAQGLTMSLNRGLKDEICMVMNEV